MRRRDVAQRQINVETTLCTSTLKFTTFNNVETTLCISTLNWTTLGNVETTLCIPTSIFTTLDLIVLQTLISVTCQWLAFKICWRRVTRNFFMDNFDLVLLNFTLYPQVFCAHQWAKTFMTKTFLKNNLSPK